MSGDILFWVLAVGAVCFFGLLIREEFFAPKKKDETEFDNIKIGGTD